LNDEVSLLNRKASILYGNVTVEQAWRLVEVVEPLVILDVRTLSEYEEGHIEGAINIPVTSLLQRIGDLDRENEILVYCGLGICSSRALNMLNSYNFSKVYSIIGGIEAWKQAGYLVV
jgi:hydroxyacylglutathione hydrolase